MEYSCLVDVTTHKCFPTLIHEFKLDLDNDKMLDYVYGMKRSVVPGTNVSGPSQDDLHKSLIFKPLVDELTLLHDGILQKLEYEYDKIEITNMWANHLQSVDTHPPHTHSNSILSGVYYLLAGKETAPIQFFDPRVQASILGPRRKNMNWYNSNMISFNSVIGVGFIFPSWLQHWVPSTQLVFGQGHPTQHERISVSWNVLVRGHYGEPNTFQNAYI